MAVDRLCLLLASGLIACSDAGQPLEDVRDAGPDDAIRDAALEAATPPDDSGICCQITDNISDDEYWQSCRFPCPYGSEAGQNVADIPWLCNLHAPTTCDDPACVLGSTCQGVNGYGIVLACDAPRSSTTIVHLTTLCPM